MAGNYQDKVSSRHISNVKHSVLMAGPGERKQAGLSEFVPLLPGT